MATTLKYACAVGRCGGMRIGWIRPSRVWMVAVPATFAAGVAAARWESRGGMPEAPQRAASTGRPAETPATPAPAATPAKPAPACEYDEPIDSIISDERATGYDDIDGDGEVDCWAGWNPGGSCCYGVELEVRPGCGEKSWFTNTVQSTHDHLQLVVVPRAAGVAAARPLARALWGELPIDEPGAWKVHDDPLHVWLLGARYGAPDPWADPTPGAFGEPVDVRDLPRVPGWPDREVATSRPHVTLFTAAAAYDLDLIDAVTRDGAAAVLVAHTDGECERTKIADCDGGGSVWQSGQHLAWKHHGRWWSWIHASEGWWSIDEVACIGQDLVLIRERDGADARVTLVDVSHFRAATLAGVSLFSDSVGGVDLSGDDSLTVGADELRRRLLAAPAHAVPEPFALVTMEAAE